MSLQVSVCPRGKRVSASVDAGMSYPPDLAYTPLGTWQTPPQDQEDTPPVRGRHPPSPSPCDLADTPLPFPPGPGRHPPGPGRHHPPGMLTPTYSP